MALSDRDYMRPSSSRKPSWLASWTPLHWIIAINILVFLAQHMGEMWVDQETDALGLGTVFHLQGGVSLRAVLAGRLWTPITYMFVHETLLHLVGNLLCIGFVGQRIQSLLGPRNFLLIYFLGGLLGAAAQLLVYWYVAPGQDIELIGASACASALLLALASLLPDERITALIYFIVPVTARLWNLAIGFLILELFLGGTALFWPWARVQWGQIAYFAHIGGALLGWQYVKLLGFGGHPLTYERLWRHRQPTRPRRREVARVRRAQVVAEVDHVASRPRQTQAGMTARPATMDDVDRILDKIGTQGMSSLSEEEKRLLDQVSREISRREGRSQP